MRVIHVLHLNLSRQNFAIRYIKRHMYVNVRIILIVRLT